MQLANQKKIQMQLANGKKNPDAIGEFFKNSEKRKKNPDAIDENPDAIDFQCFWGKVCFNHDLRLFYMRDSFIN